MLNFHTAKGFSTVDTLIMIIIKLLVEFQLDEHKNLKVSGLVVVCNMNETHPPIYKNTTKYTSSY